jgi:uncharacterized protein
MMKRFTFHPFTPAGLAVLLASPTAVAQPAPMAAPVPPPIAQFQADCARPQYASDALVCGDFELATLDAEVAGLAAPAPAIAAAAIWEDQTAWFRRRSLCAFKADHRDCLIAAYADRRSVLIAATAPTTETLICTGAWEGMGVTGSLAAAGEAVTFRANGALLGVATINVNRWQPMLAWRAGKPGVKLKAQDGRQFHCRPARP